MYSEFTIDFLLFVQIYSRDWAEFSGNHCIFNTVCAVLFQPCEYPWTLYNTENPSNAKILEKNQDCYATIMDEPVLNTILEILKRYKYIIPVWLVEILIYFQNYYNFTIQERTITITMIDESLSIYWLFFNFEVLTSQPSSIHIVLYSTIRCM